MKLKCLDVSGKKKKKKKTTGFFLAQVAKCSKDSSPVHTQPVLAFVSQIP